MTAVTPQQVATIDARAVAETVPDPELPMLTLADLGVLRDVRTEDDGTGVDGGLHGGHEVAAGC